jgi:hypothetical protein
MREQWNGSGGDGNGGEGGRGERERALGLRGRAGARVGVWKAAAPA